MKSILTGLCNLWFFRKVIWNFRWWDYSFNLELLRKSIEYTADETEKKGTHLSHPESVVKMRELISLLEKVRHEEIFIEQAEKEIGYQLTGFDFEQIEGTDKYRLVNKPGHNSELSKKVQVRTTELEEINWRKIWFILRKEMRNWWD